MSKMCVKEMGVNGVVLKEMKPQLFFFPKKTFYMFLEFSCKNTDRH